MNSEEIELQLQHHDLSLIDESHEGIILIWETERYNDIPVAGICKRLDNTDDKILFFATKLDCEKIYIFEMHDNSLKHVTNHIQDFRDNLGYCNDYGELYNPIVDIDEGYTKISRRSPLKTYELYVNPLFYVSYNCVVNQQKDDKNSSCC